MASTFGGRSRSSFGSGSGSWERSSLSFNQALALAMEAKKSNRSLLGSIMHKGGSTLGFALKQILRPSYGMAEGTRRALEGKGVEPLDFAKGFSRGFKLKTDTTFSDVLKQEGVLKGHGRLRGVAGFGLDVVTDPTLPLQIAAVVGTGGAAAPGLVSARLALLTAEKAAVVASKAKTASEITKAAGIQRAAAGEAVRAARTLGPEFASVKAAANYQSIMARNTLREARGESPRLLTGAAEENLDEVKMALARLDASEKLTGEKVLQASYKIPFSMKRVALTPTSIGGIRVAPKAPSLLRTAKGGGVVGKIPGMKTAATTTGRIFKHHFGEEPWNKALLIQGHVAQDLTEKYLKRATTHFSKTKLDDDAIYGAWKWAERQENLIGPGRVMNEAHLASGVGKGIDDAQAAFLKEYHDYTEFLRARDREFGIPYKKDLPENKLYIPHIYHKSGTPVQVSKATLPNYTKKRVQLLTAAEMHTIHLAKKAGTATKEQKELMTEPMPLLMTRTRRGAQAHVNEALFQHMAHSHGVPLQIPDLEKMRRLEIKMMNSEKKFKKNAWVYNAAKRKTWIANRTNQLRKDIKAKARRRDYQIKKEGASIHADDKRILQRRLDAADKFDKEIKDAVHTARVEYQELLEKGEKAAKTHAKIADNAAKQLARGVYKDNDKVPSYLAKLDKNIGGVKYAFEPELKHNMQRVESIMRSDEQLQALAGTMMKFMAEWKVLVTSVNPGYRVRNTISDVWNMYISGVPVWAIAKYGGRAAAQYKRAVNVRNKMAAAQDSGTNLVLSRKEREALRNWHDAAGQGVMSGLFQGDIDMVAMMVRNGGMSKAYMKRGNPLRSYERMMQTFNRHAENVGRFTHYLARREGEKLSVVDSANWAKKAHFDYTELSHTERTKFRAFIPFYTWTRKNIPYQLTQMVANPGRFATFPKFVRDSAEMATGSTEVENEGLLPAYMRDKMAFQIPLAGANTWMLPMIGAGDLAKLSGNPINQIMQMTGPWVKLPYEMATGRSLFSGEKIAERERRPVGGFAASVLKHIPGANVGRTSRGGIEAQGVNPWFAHVLGQTPFTSAFLDAGNPVSASSRGKIGPISTKSLGYVTGFPIYKRNQEQELVIAELKHNEELKRVLRRLRDRGIIPEAEQPGVSPFRKKLRKEIAHG